MNIELSGILPALITPLNEDYSVNFGVLEQLLDRLYQSGVNGVYVCGQTGEGMAQSNESRRQVLETAIRCSPKGKLVIAHIGAARLDDALALARHAESSGAHALSSLPPVGSFGFSEVRAWYEELTSATSLPFLPYYFPEASPTISNYEQIEDLCSLPNVVGIKFTDFDLYKLQRLSRKGLTIFNGRDEVLCAGLLMGACGGIGSFYNVAPDLFQGIFEHTKKGEWEQARELQDRVNELIAIVLRYPMLAALKRMLAWTGLDCGPCLRPRRMLTPALEAELVGELSAAKFDLELKLAVPQARV